MRVLQMDACADPVGGANIYMIGLADELARRGHTVGIFGTSPDREVDGPRTRILRRPSWNPSLLVRDRHLTRALEAFIRKIDPDIIHVHNLYSLALEVDRCLLASGRPVIQTMHDYSVVCPNAWCVRGDGTECPGGAGRQCFEHECEKNYPFDASLVLVTRLRHRLLRRLMRVVISISCHETALLEKHGFREVCQVFNYVDAEKIATPPRSREDRSLLYLGRLDHEKGVAYLLAAMPRILEAEPDTRLTLVGEGPAAGELQGQASRLGLQDRVTFHGKVPYEEVKRFYAVSTLMVLPSVWCENSPLTAYECMVAGLPMVGSRIGGIPDLVVEGETGLLVEPRNPEDIAEKVVHLLRAPEERARMSARARDRAGLFTREKTVDRIEEIYRSVLAGPQDPPPEAEDASREDFLMACLHHICVEQHEHEVYEQDLLVQVRTLKANAKPWPQLKILARKAAGKLGLFRR